jgi:hypothetical protein
LRSSLLWWTQQWEADEKSKARGRGKDVHLRPPVTTDPANHSAAITHDSRLKTITQSLDDMDPSAPLVVDNGTGVGIRSAMISPALSEALRFCSSSRSDTLVPTFPSMVSAITVQLTCFLAEDISPLPPPYQSFHP